MKNSRARNGFLVVLLLALSAQRAAAQCAPPDELTAIRELDRVNRKEGRPFVGIILDRNPLDRESFRIRMGGVQLSVNSNEVASIIPRQSKEMVYANWTQWLKKNHYEDRKERARCEFELALWCHYPHPSLAGEAPNEPAAVGHFENAVRLDPTLEEVYPYLEAIYSRRHPFEVDGLGAFPGAARGGGDGSAGGEESGDLEDLDREAETYQLALKGGYSSAVINFRLGMILARRFGLLEGAVRYLEAVLADTAANAGQRRQCRALLAEAYLRRGDEAKALALYEKLLSDTGGAGEGTASQTGGASTEGGGATASEPAENFEPCYALARLRLRMGGAENQRIARDLLARAQKIQPDFLEIHLDLAALDYVGGDAREKLLAADKRLRTYLAQHAGDSQAAVDRALIQIRLGKFAAAEKILDGVSAASGPAAARVHIARGLIAEFRQNESLAFTEYTDARGIADGGAANRTLARLLLSASLVRQGKLAEARQEIEAIRGEHREDRRVFGACSRLLAAIDAKEGKPSSASAHLEYAVDVDKADAPLLELTGLMFLRAGQLQRGVAFLNDAQKLAPDRPPSLNGLGYVQYQQGDVEAAKDLFLNAQKRIKSWPRETRSAWRDEHKAYAADAIEQIRDLENLEVLIDDFEGADGPQIDGWDKVEIYGVTISRRAGTAVFEGTQANSPDGETTMTLMRPIESRSFERATASIRLGSGDAVPILGLGTTSGGRQAAAGLKIYRDVDGLVKVQFQTARGGWEEPKLREITEEETEDEEDKASARRTSRSARAPEEYRHVPWPADGGFHVLEIRAGTSLARTRRSKVFDLYFDGQWVARNLAVSGLTGTHYQSGLGGRTDGLGKAYSFTVENFKVYRQKGGRSSASTRGYSRATGKGRR